MHRAQKLNGKNFILLFAVPAMFIGGLLAFSTSPAAAANDCQLYRDDEHVQLENLVKSRQLPKALEMAKVLYRHYDECQKATSIDAESRVMNQSWRADTAIIMTQIYHRTDHPLEARRLIRDACKDYRVVVDATNVDTTTRKMANQAIEKNCSR